MPSPCANHSDQAGWQICDSCNRFLCRNCIDEITWFAGLGMHYCHQASCNQAFLKKARKWLTGFGAFLLLFLVLITALLIRSVIQRDLFDIAGQTLMLLINIPNYRIFFGIFRDYRRRNADPGSHPS